jgi:hypothetical protein
VSRVLVAVLLLAATAALMWNSPRVSQWRAERAVRKAERHSPEN